MKSHSSPVQPCIEPLESRQMLSADANIVGTFKGTATHGKTVFASTVIVTGESRRGIIYGTTSIRFSKHDQPVYSFTGRVLGDTITIDIPTHDISITGTVNTRHATITGTGSTPQGSAVFSLVLVT